MIYNPSMFDAEKDTEMFLKCLEMEWPEQFGRYSRFYNIATESIKDYVNKLGTNIETALTVGASADQGIALCKNGAKNIYYFDINRADYYFIALKIGAFLNLKRKDFLDFLIAEKGQTILNYRLYQKIRDNLSEPVKCFWDNLYKYFNYKNDLMEYYLFRSTKKHSSMSRVINDYYINNENYYETKDKLKDSNWYFIESDFYELQNNLPEELNFDTIVLSNIYEYLNFGEDVTIENAKRYVNFIKNVLIPKLKKNGSIMASYLCRYDDNVDDYISLSLKADPNNWAIDTKLLSGLDNIEKYLSGYTGQNVSYHYLLQELKQEFDFEKITTAHSGYGISSASSDMALIIKK